MKHRAREDINQRLYEDNTDNILYNERKEKE
jgi:hypothetical protein